MGTPESNQQVSHITADDLFSRTADVLSAGDNAMRIMHEVLVLACHEGLSSTTEAFGNLFAQVDYLCRAHHISIPNTIAIQRMRRNSNHSMQPQHDMLLYDCKALALFISAIFGTPIPDYLVRVLPAEASAPVAARHIEQRCLRCMVKAVNDDSVLMALDEDVPTTLVYVQSQYMYGQHDLLRTGMQVNLLDVSFSHDEKGNVWAQPDFVIMEPDLLYDISSLARCFTQYGHSPYAYIINRMAPAANSAAILLGNFAGTALDDIIHHPDDYHWTDTLRNHFRQQALEYCTCADLEPAAYKQMALQQTQNIKGIVDFLFAPGRYDRDKAVLEPSFVCEQLGLQGRVDLMTTDFKLLVEQKSGKNINIERHQPDATGNYQRQDHYVQVLLYYGILRRNFNLSRTATNFRLMYSKYPLPGGLVVVNYYQQLFREVLALRNRIVCLEMQIASQGFESVIDQLTGDCINERGIMDKFFLRYIKPQTESITNILHRITPLEKAYFCRMMTFVYREQLCSRLGTQEGVGNATAFLWNMPLTEKRETGNIYTDLTISALNQTDGTNGYDLVTLSVPSQGDDFLPNFRLGDSVYLYAYRTTPDVRSALLYRGALVKISEHQITVHLNDGQQNANLFKFAPADGNRTGDHSVKYAIEHCDYGGSSAIKSLHAFISAPQYFKDVMLAQRAPQQLPATPMQNQYPEAYHPIVEKAMQAADYFLLVGPPGTGKTSMALQFLVREALWQKQCGATSGGDGSVLLMAYTNRAVDEICSMLGQNSLPYIRIGNEYSCDPACRDHLLPHVLSGYSKLSDIRRVLEEAPVIVGTTSTMLSKSSIFSLKKFSLAIVDEASQILEPSIVGLLALMQQNGNYTVECHPRFILIGDYKQLPAVVQQNQPMANVDNPLLQQIGLTDCRSSLFERLLLTEQRAGRTAFTGVLNHQGRMHPDVAWFPDTHFYTAEAIRPVPLPHQLERSLGYTAPANDEIDRVLMQQRMVFFPSEKCDDCTSDKVNPSEARIVADVLKRVHRFYGRQFDAARTVGVIVPYRNQIAMIRREVEKLGIPGLNQISIDTVERYQGSQRDVIIYSFTIQHRYQLNFLTANTFSDGNQLIDRKLNVVLTRARKQLIITGNEQVLSKNPLFAELIHYIKAQNHTTGE